MDNLGPTEVLASFHGLYLSAQAYLFKFISPRSFRLLLVLSVYLIARPYFLKGGAKRQAQELDKVLAEGKTDGDNTSGKPGSKQAPAGAPHRRIVELEDSDSDEAMSRKDGGKAKRRQMRRTMREIVEDKREAAGGAESDQEIENLLKSSIK